MLARLQQLSPAWACVLMGRRACAALGRVSSRKDSMPAEVQAAAIFAGGMRGPSLRASCPLVLCFLEVCLHTPCALQASMSTNWGCAALAGLHRQPAASKHETLRMQPGTPECTACHEGHCSLPGTDELPTQERADSMRPAPEQDIPALVAALLRRMRDEGCTTQEAQAVQQLLASLPAELAAGLQGPVGHPPAGQAPAEQADAAAEGVSERTPLQQQPQVLAEQPARQTASMSKGERPASRAAASLGGPAQGGNAVYREAAAGENAQVTPIITGTHSCVPDGVDSLGCQDLGQPRLLPLFLSRGSDEAALAALLFQLPRPPNTLTVPVSRV